MDEIVRLLKSIDGKLEQRKREPDMQTLVVEFKERLRDCSGFLDPNGMKRKAVERLIDEVFLSVKFERKTRFGPLRRVYESESSQ